MLLKGLTPFKVVDIRFSV